VPKHTSTEVSVPATATVSCWASREVPSSSRCAATTRQRPAGTSVQVNRPLASVQTRIGALSPRLRGSDCRPTAHFASGRAAASSTVPRTTAGVEPRFRVALVRFGRSSVAADAAKPSCRARSRITRSCTASSAMCRSRHRCAATRHSSGATASKTLASRRASPVRRKSSNQRSGRDRITRCLDGRRPECHRKVAEVRWRPRARCRTSGGGTRSGTEPAGSAGHNRAIATFLFAARVGRG
jgi:hypothetical protein